MVGVQFFHNTTLQLRNPQNMVQAGSYTKLQMYFKTKQDNALLAYLGADNPAAAQHVSIVCLLVLGINCNFMFEYWLQLSNRWLIIISLWWALKSWWYFSTSYKFCGTIHVIYFFQIPVVMNCWSIVSNRGICFEKKENLFIGYQKVFRFYLKEWSLHKQLFISFNFDLVHQFNCPNQLTFDYNQTSVHHYCFLYCLHTTINPIL